MRFQLEMIDTYSVAQLLRELLKICTIIIDFGLIIDFYKAIGQVLEAICAVIGIVFSTIIDAACKCLNSAT